MADLKRGGYARDERTEHIGVLEQTIAEEKKLIIALRQRTAEHPEADEADLPGLRSAIQRGGAQS